MVCVLVRWRARVVCVGERKAAERVIYKGMKSGRERIRVGEDEDDETPPERDRSRAGPTSLAEHTRCRLATSDPARLAPHHLTPPNVPRTVGTTWLPSMRCCIKRTRLVRRVDASALNLALPFGEEAVDALQPVLQFPETRTRELEEGRRNTGDRELYRVSAGRLTRHHHCEVCGGDLQRTA